MKNLIVLPLLCESEWSLLVIEGASNFLRYAKGLVQAYRTLDNVDPPERDTDFTQRRGELLDFCLRQNSVSDIFESELYHLDRTDGAHEKYRPSMRKWVKCMFQSVIESELGELPYSGLMDFVMEKYSDVVVPTIPEEGIPDCTPGLDAIGFLLIVLDYENRDLLFQNNARRVPGEYFDRDVTAAAITIAFKNYCFAARHGGSLSYVLRGKNVLEAACTLIESKNDLIEGLVLPASLPIIYETLLRIVDDHGFKNRELYEREIPVQHRNKYAIRKWSYKLLLPSIAASVRIERKRKKKPRTQRQRFWNAIFDEVKCLPPFKDSRNVFDAMRRFPDSLLLSLGINLLYNKRSSIAEVPVQRPRFPADMNPWKTFNHSLSETTDETRVGGWFTRGSWGRMQECAVIMLGCTEYIIRCINSASVTNHFELVEKLRTISTSEGDPWNVCVSCGIPAVDMDRPYKLKEETIEEYRTRALPFATKNAESVNDVMTIVGRCFHKSLAIFGSAFGATRGDHTANVYLHKLRVIPANALDFLWEKVMEKIRDKWKDDFLTCDGFHAVESELNRIFRCMNTVYSISSDKSLFSAFTRSIEDARIAIPTHEMSRKFGKVSIQKLKSVPASGLWNYTEDRYGAKHYSDRVIERLRPRQASEFGLQRSDIVIPAFDFSLAT